MVAIKIQRFISNSMKKLALILILITPSWSWAANIYSQLTNGTCQDMYCYNKYNYRALTNGECEDLSCYNKYNFRALTNGECEDLSCYNKYTYRSLTNGQCEDVFCATKYISSTTGTTFSSGSYSGGGSYYNYDITGYGDTGYAYGNIDTYGDGDVDGYIYLEDGNEVYFDGEFIGNGLIEGYDENGNWYEFEVD